MEEVQCIGAACNEVLCGMMLTKNAMIVYDGSMMFPGRSAMPNCTIRSPI